MNKKSALHLSSDFCLMTPRGQAYPGNPDYTITMNIVVTDESGQPQPNVPVFFQTAGSGGGQTEFFGADSTTDRDGLIAQKRTNADGVAEVQLCSHFVGIIDLHFYLEDGDDSQAKIASSDERQGTLLPLGFSNVQDGKLVIPKNEYSFRVSAAAKSGNAFDTDEAVIILNRKSYWLGQYSEVYNGGKQLPYHALNLDDQAQTNTMYYIAQHTSGTPYVSRYASFAVIGTPTAMPDPDLVLAWPGPRPYPAPANKTITDADLDGYLLTIHIPAGDQNLLKPYDKVTLWIYINGWTAGNDKSAKAYTRSFDYIVPPDHDPGSTLVITLSAQYFYNYSAKEGAPLSDNNIFMNYQVNGSGGWSSAWQGTIITDPQ
jgi:hypothetical protein